MFKSAKAKSASLLFVMALVFVLCASPGYSDAPQLSPDELTPWAYLPFVRRDLLPAVIRIVNVYHHVSFLPAAYEYAEIENQGGSPQNMDGWEITDRDRTAVCRFQNTVPLQPGNRAKVWTRCGGNNESNIFCCLASGEWLWNTNDTARLYNDKQELVHEYSY